jgi:hypothetical protein
VHKKCWGFQTFGSVLDGLCKPKINKNEVKLNCMTPKFNNKFEFAMAKLITHTHTHTRDPIQNQGKHVPFSQFALRSKSI